MEVTIFYKQELVGTNKGLEQLLKRINTRMRTGKLKHSEIRNNISRRFGGVGNIKN